MMRPLFQCPPFTSSKLISTSPSSPSSLAVICCSGGDQKIDRRKTKLFFLVGFACFLLLLWYQFCCLVVRILMGNKIGRRRQVVDEKYTRPQGLYQHRDIDQKKLKKLILESKLAPCYPGDEENALDLEECPICFLYYPSLNRSRCCTKGICTECFLQMKPPHQNRPTQCPFCKTANYAVEYRGGKTKEERGMEQIEEQKVIEAQIRIRQQELQDEVDKIKNRQDISSSCRTRTPVEVEYHDMCSSSFSTPSIKCMRQANDFLSSQASCSASASTRSSHLRQNRDGNFDVDLEDIMVMEAIWRSIQEHGSQGNPVSSGSFLPGPSYSEECYNSQVVPPVRVSPPGGLACAAAALAEKQHMHGSSSPVFDMLQQPGNFPTVNARFVQNTPRRWIEVSPDNGREVMTKEFCECPTDHWSEVAEEGTSYSGSDVMADAGTLAVPFSDSANMAPGNFAPENFEEQMMLAMAVSLAEAQAGMGNQRLGWH